MSLPKSSLACPFCLSNNIRAKSIPANVYTCLDCELTFNTINKQVDYSNETDFRLDPKKILMWRGFAKRDYTLISGHLQSLKKPPVILEIGSGYGLLGDYIQEKIHVKKYFHLEMNLSLKNELKNRGQLTLDSADELAYTDIVIMSHVLEHIQYGKKFLEDLMKRYPQAQIILYQTNYKGIIPKYFPLIWYGWSLDQHYSHFTPKSLEIFFSRYGYRVNMQTYYKLDQVFSFSFKGIIKGVLYIINMVIKGTQSDAFVIGFEKYNKETIER